MEQASITIYWKGVGMHHPAYAPFDKKGVRSVGVAVYVQSTGETWWYPATNPTLDRVCNAVHREWDVVSEGYD
jgi:hypothetical protein